MVRKLLELLVRRRTSPRLPERARCKRIEVVERLKCTSEVQKFFVFRSLMSLFSISSLAFLPSLSRASPLPPAQFHRKGTRAWIGAESKEALLQM